MSYTPIERMVLPSLSFKPAGSISSSRPDSRSTDEDHLRVMLTSSALALIFENSTEAGLQLDCHQVSLPGSIALSKEPILSSPRACKLKSSKHKSSKVALVIFIMSKQVGPNIEKGPYIVFLQKYGPAGYTFQIY